MESGAKAITSFGSAQRFNADVCEHVCTVDPVVFRDVRAYVVLVGRRAQGSRERRVFAEEIRSCADVQVLIWPKQRKDQLLNFIGMSSNVLM